MQAGVCVCGTRDPGRALPAQDLAARTAACLVCFLEGGHTEGPGLSPSLPKLLSHLALVRWSTKASC